MSSILFLQTASKTHVRPKGALLLTKSRATSKERTTGSIGSGFWLWMCNGRSWVKAEAGRPSLQNSKGNSEKSTRESPKLTSLHILQLQKQTQVGPPKQRTLLVSLFFPQASLPCTRIEFPLLPFASATLPLNPEIDPGESDLQPEPRKVATRTRKTETLKLPQLLTPTKTNIFDYGS